MGRRFLPDSRNLKALVKSRDKGKGFFLGEKVR